MCDSKDEGGRRCPSCQNGQAQDRQRAVRADHRHRDGQNKVTAYIGATPFRPESEALLSMSSRPSYYDSDEWNEWSDRIQNEAEHHGVTIEDGTPEQVHADGLWLGETEPSGAYTVTGTREDINKWAATIGGHYNQDAVMVMYADANGPDRLYRFDQNDKVAAKEALAAMQEAGVPGGRIVDGELQIVSTADDPISPAALDLIRQRIGADTVLSTPVSVDFVEKDEKAAEHTPIKEIQGIRQRHAEKHGLPVRGAVPHLTERDDIAAAMAYEAAPHTPDDPKVKRSYRALARHLREQHDALTAAGYTFEPWHGEEEQPYANSAEMMKDLRENKHLYYYRTEMSQETEGALSADHPMAREVVVHDKDGKEQRQVINDVFRAVHDAIAHSEGHKFGPHGEKMAWWAHRSSLPREAHLALWNETRAQNVWTNAGPHLRTKDSGGEVRLLKKGEEGWVGLADRPYAEQKCTVVPNALT